MFENNRPKIAVIGLGYVGLPLAVALAKNYVVTGYDISASRIADLKNNVDKTLEISAEELEFSTLSLSATEGDLHGHDVFIVTVPTPINEHNEPDLEPLRQASICLSKYLKASNIVVFESTVYPGVTEDFCAPIIEAASGLKAGSDFYLGYSPERINPGDKVHTLAKITKVVAGQNDLVTEQLAIIYGSINNGNIFRASSIRVAEAAKVIENTQRDINIALINELTIIFSKLNICIYDVLEAAGTKWNFLNFTPGLVGGHCIGVDPYYLAMAAQNSGSDPKLILAGRQINEDMAFYLATFINNNIEPGSKILILGLTFKENVPDLRNTKVVNLIDYLKKFGHELVVHDAAALATEAKKFYDLDLAPNLNDLKNKFDVVVGAVSHESYLALNPTIFIKNISGKIFDLKNMWKIKQTDDHQFFRL